jgi:drug/metabolite transporter (DMT)-like permease
MKKHSTADLMLVFCTLIWGGTFPAIKIALQQISPWTVVCLRFSFAGLLFAAIYRRRLVQANLQLMLRGIALGLFFFAGFSLQTFGLVFTSSSRSAFITEMLVIFIPLIYYVMYRRAPSIFTSVGIVVVLFGLFLLTSPGGELTLNGGDWLTLGCALAFSAYIIGVGAWSAPETRGVLSTLQCLTVAALSLLGVDLRGAKLVAGAELWLALSYLALPGTVIVVLLQMHYQPQTTPARAGVIFALEPVFAMVYAVLLGLEDASPRAITGAVVVTFGVVLSELGSAWNARSSVADARRSATGICRN